MGRTLISWGVQDAWSTECTQICFAHDHHPSLGYTAIIYTRQLADNNANKAIYNNDYYT